MMLLSTREFMNLLLDHGCLQFQFCMQWNNAMNFVFWSIMKPLNMPGTVQYINRTWYKKGNSIRLFERPRLVHKQGYPNCFQVMQWCLSIFKNTDISFHDSLANMKSPVPF